MALELIEFEWSWNAKTERKNTALRGHGDTAIEGREQTIERMVYDLGNVEQSRILVESSKDR